MTAASTLRRVVNHRVVHVVRHGESQWNVDRRLQGQTAHVPLTLRGERQALAVADRLAGSAAVLVLSSDLRRAVDTARPIADRLKVPLQTDPALREQSLGVYEGMLSSAVFAAVGADAKADPDWRPTGGESVRDVYGRVQPFLTGVLDSAPDGPVVVVTHGDTARVLFAILQGMPAEMAPLLVPANGGIVAVTYQPADVDVA